MIIYYLLYIVVLSSGGSSSCTEGQQFDTDTCTPRTCINGIIVTHVVECPDESPCIAGRCCTSCKEELQIDRWIKSNNLNQYGDARDTMYAGGTPLYDEASGYSLDRYDYIRQAHPDAPWNTGSNTGTSSDSSQEQGSGGSGVIGDTGDAGVVDGSSSDTYTSVGYPSRPSPYSHNSRSSPYSSRPGSYSSRPGPYSSRTAPSPYSAPGYGTYPAMLMRCEMWFRKPDCMAHYPQCAWVFDEDSFICTEPKEIESGKQFWASQNAYDAGYGGANWGNVAMRMQDPEVYQDIMEAMGALFPTGQVPTIGGFDPNTYDPSQGSQGYGDFGSSFGGNGRYNPVQYLNCGYIHHRDTCNRTPGCTWTFDDAMLLCQETKEVESYKDYWKSGGRFGSIPPDMMPGGAINPFGRVNPRRPPDAAPRPAHAPAGGRPRSVNADTQPSPASSDSTGTSTSGTNTNSASSSSSSTSEGWTGSSSSTSEGWTSSSSSTSDGFPMRPVTPWPMRPVTPVSSMGGVPMRPMTPSTPGHPAMGSYPSPGSGMPPNSGVPGIPPMLLDCELIRTAKKCFANPRCSWIVDDSMWVCQETKEVETSKQFWRVTNMNQGHMPGPIPGTTGFGGMPGPDVSPIAGAFPLPSRRMPPPSTPSSAASEGSTTIVEGQPSYSAGLTPGFNYQLRNILDKTNTNQAHEHSSWIYFFLASGSFLAGLSVVFVLPVCRRRSKATTIPDNFVRLGEDRKV